MTYLARTDERARVGHVCSLMREARLDEQWSCKGSAIKLRYQTYKVNRIELVIDSLPNTASLSICSSVLTRRENQMKAHFSYIPSCWGIGLSVSKWTDIWEISLQIGPFTLFANNDK